MNETHPPGPHGRCDRAGLLLSLRADGAETPEQGAELDAHLAACASCRTDERADRAVGDRLRERARGVVPEGFSAAVVAAALRDRAAAVAQNRFLRRAAAAAVLVAATSLGLHALDRRTAADDGTPSASARDSARAAVVRPRALPTERR